MFICSVYIDWNSLPMKEGRKPNYGDKTMMVNSREGYSKAPQITLLES